MGKIRHRNRVSDHIPTSLAGAVFEAQVVVIADFHSMKQEQEQAQMQQEGSISSSTNVIDSRQYMVPIWSQVPDVECFRQQCGSSDHWKEYIAFMNPESYGIHLERNWPSLCSSCIEISRNQFVYKTTVRILGDLSRCVLPAISEMVTTSPPLPPASSSNEKRYIHNAPKDAHHPNIKRMSKQPYTNPKSKSRRQPHTSLSQWSKRQQQPQPSPQSTFTLAELIVDPATFKNLTMYDSVNVISSIDHRLQVQFRFVLCDP
ncbi:hypothetical protein BGZ94_006198 [Podila epigama]|nr:hypothetical protein BGZ94_006198 [Podila epigama]